MPNGKSGLTQKGLGDLFSGDFIGGTVAPLAGMFSTGIGDLLKLFAFFEGRKQRQPGAWGKVSPEQAAGWPLPPALSGGTQPGLKMTGAGALGQGGPFPDYLRSIMPDISGMPVRLEEIRLEDEAKDRGIEGAEWAMETIAGSPAAERLENLRSLDPTVISQLTFDKNAAAIIDNINRQARQTAETQTAAAGARGLSPDAIASIQSGTAMTGRREAMGDIAQLDLQRAMVNDEATRAWEALIGNLQSQLYQQYEPWGMAKLGLESTPPDLSGLLGDIKMEDLMKSGYDPALIGELGNMFGERGGDLLSFFSDYQGREAMQAASEPDSGSGGLGAGIGGLLGWMFGGPGTGALGASAGYGIGSQF